MKAKCSAACIMKKPDFTYFTILARLLTSVTANNETEGNAALEAVEACRFLQPIFPGAVFPDPTCWDTLNIPT